ncbi:MAG: HDIG domain-containing protein [Desulfobacteraceae bacterium]|nr:MAG: HDIG domain-containing protein [Desulfobacteraceae bacterium]
MTLSNTIINIINEFYPTGAPARDVFLSHSEAVARKALQVARKVPHLNPDLEFVEQAAMLHDIGIFYARAPEIGCFGEYPYVCHGYLGRQLMETKGLFRHALVCERHVGVGLTLEEILKYPLPLPHRDMVPVSLEEQIVCYADKFFSKKPGKSEEWPVEMVLKSLETYGPQKVARFKEWLAVFGENS